MGGFPVRPSRDSETSQYRHHRARRSRQDHPRGSVAAAIRHARCAQGPAGAGHGLERPGARARHHHSGEEYGDHLGRLPHQHRRHPRPRRFRRRSRTGARHGGLRAAAGRRGGRPHAADPFRDSKGVQAWPASHRGHQQNRPRRSASGLGARSNLRFVRPFGGHRRATGFPGGRMPPPCADSPASSPPCATATCSRCSRPSSSIVRLPTSMPTAPCSCRSRCSTTRAMSAPSASGASSAAP